MSLYIEKKTKNRNTQCHMQYKTNLSKQFPFKRDKTTNLFI